MSTVTVNQWTQKAARKMTRVMRESCGVTGGNVRERTPRDTEALADSWQESVPHNQLLAGQQYLFFTDLHYARDVEYLGNVPRRPGITRYHPRGPYSMRSSSVAEWQQNVRVAARGV